MLTRSLAGPPRRRGRCDRDCEPVPLAHEANGPVWKSAGVTVRTWYLAAAIFAAIVVAIVVIRDDDHAVAPPPMTNVTDVDIQPTWVDLPKEADSDKPGAMRGVLKHIPFEQPPRQSGRTPSSIRFRPDAPMEVVGVKLSIDIGDVRLTEFTVAVNAENGYSTPARDTLMHVTDLNDGSSSIDEQVWFPEPFLLDAGDWAAVDAWVSNWSTRVGVVSPEVILFYRWV